MTDDAASLVYPILSRTLGIKKLLGREDQPQIERCQDELVRRLTPGVRWPWSFPGADEVRYALVCWIDETFIDDPSPWGKSWNERKLEVALFRTNDRAWKFWEHAEHLLATGDGDSVEVYLLCVMLGFRGHHSEDLPIIRAWSEKAKALVRSSLTAPWEEPASKPPQSYVPPLQGGRRLRRATARLGLVALVTLPLLIFLIVARIGR